MNERKWDHYRTWSNSNLIPLCREGKKMRSLQNLIKLELENTCKPDPRRNSFVNRIWQPDQTLQQSKIWQPDQPIQIIINLWTQRNSSKEFSHNTRELKHTHDMTQSNEVSTPETLLKLLPIYKSPSLTCLSWATMHIICHSYKDLALDQHVIAVWGPTCYRQRVAESLIAAS